MNRRKNRRKKNSSQNPKLRSTCVHIVSLGYPLNLRQWYTQRRGGRQLYAIEGRFMNTYRRSDNGWDYLVASVLGVVATQHTPQWLSSPNFSVGSPSVNIICNTCFYSFVINIQYFILSSLNYSTFKCLFFKVTMLHWIDNKTLIKSKIKNWSITYVFFAFKRQNIEREKGNKMFVEFFIGFLAAVKLQLLPFI